MKAIPEFAAGDYSVENKRVSLEKGLARACFIKENGVIISSASSTAENSQSAMIVGVGTLPKYQKNGLASYCMSKLCEELLAEGKMLCLFYDNPTAGSIYKRMGFVDIGKWCMWKF
jgi:predicted GNAT family acetyltransferase